MKLKLLSRATCLAAALALIAACAQEVAQRGDLPLHHNPDGGFRNLPGSPKREAGFFDMMGFFSKMIFNSEEVVNPPGHILPKQEVQTAALTAPNPSVTWLGHAAFLVRSGGKVVLTDPFLGPNAGPYIFGPKRHAAPAMTVEELPDIDVILISHNHYDHLDYNTLNNLKNKATVEAVVPLGVGAIFREMGYKRVHELDWWQERTFDRLRVQLLPAVHFSGRGLFDRNDTLWGSFGIYGDGTKIYFSGDTAHGPVFKEIGQKAGPFDLALVAIGAFKPRLIMKAVHANPDEAVQILQDVRARQGIGMHWGTIRLTLEPPWDTPDLFRASAKRRGYGKENAIVLKIGETFALPEQTASVN